MIKLLSFMLILNACTSLPQPPKGFIYRRIGNGAICSKLEDGTACPQKKLSDLTNVYMLSFPTWQAIQNYQDALIRKAKGN